MAQEADGHAHLLLTPGEFQSFVSGIVEGQALLAGALGGPQAICVDPMMTRVDVANLVAPGLPGNIQSYAAPRATFLLVQRQDEDHQHLAERQLVPAKVNFSCPRSISLNLGERDP